MSVAPPAFNMSSSDVVLGRLSDEFVDSSPLHHRSDALTLLEPNGQEHKTYTDIMESISSGATKLTTFPRCITLFIYTYYIESK
jgi:hypothetical protein